MAHHRALPQSLLRWCPLGVAFAKRIHRSGPSSGTGAQWRTTGHSRSRCCAGALWGSLSPRGLRVCLRIVGALCGAPSCGRCCQQTVLACGACCVVCANSSLPPVRSHALVTVAVIVAVADCADSASSRAVRCHFPVAVCGRARRGRPRPEAPPAAAPEQGPIPGAAADVGLTPGARGEREGVGGAGRAWGGGGGTQRQPRRSRGSHYVKPQTCLRCVSFRCA